MIKFIDRSNTKKEHVISNFKCIFKTKYILYFSIKTTQDRSITPIYLWNDVIIFLITPRTSGELHMMHSTS